MYCSLKISTEFLIKTSEHYFFLTVFWPVAVCKNNKCYRYKSSLKLTHQFMKRQYCETRFVKTHWYHPFYFIFLIFERNIHSFILPGWLMDFFVMQISKNLVSCLFFYFWNKLMRRCIIFLFSLKSFEMQNWNRCWMKILSASTDLRYGKIIFFPTWRSINSEEQCLLDILYRGELNV